MRIDPDTCNDPVILAAEVRRLQAVIDAEPLTLTDAERGLLDMLADHPVTHQIMPHEVATLRGLLERCSQFAKRESDRPQPIAKRESDRSQPIECTPEPHATPGEGSVQGE